MAIPPASPNKNLDEDLSSSRLTRYNNIQSEVKTYLHDILSPRYPDLFNHKFSTSSQSYESIDLCELLKDGEILCRLGQLIPVANNPTTKFKNSKMAFMQMENISFFLKLCEVIKLPHDEIFQTVDLFESKDPYQICITLMSFSRIAHDLDSQVFFKVIGPKIVKVKPTVPTKPYKLRS
ncbi:Transgelin [Candida viswanathii]|uniref:Transgelin n=1 Tax=Candida viswanathii TaxID=5486 RepID=A0A367YPP2_9ASCO|nr:Transgelin [Candida viswanathii]